MGQRHPMVVAVALVAVCALGIASVYLPWASVNLFGAVIAMPGSSGWAGQVTAAAFGVLAAACVVQLLWPRLPRRAPLTLAVVVGLGVLAITLGPSLLYPYAELSVAGGPPERIPSAIGVGKYVAMAAGATVALVAAWQLWQGRRVPAAGVRPAEPGDAADRSLDSDS
jgi:hypothetical protein